MNTFENIDFQTGDLLLYHDDGWWFSKLVEKLSKSKYCHIAMIIKDPNFDHFSKKGIFIIESSGYEPKDAEDNKYKLGVQIHALSTIIENFRGNIYYRKLICNRDENFYKILDKIHEKTHDKPYDLNLCDCIKMLCHLTFGKIHKTNTFWCSSLIGYIYTQLGFLDKNTPWTLLKPKDFGHENNRDKLKFKNCKLLEEILIKLT